MEATPGFEPGIKILQTFALPLGDVAALYAKKWSGRRDLNPRQPRWQRGALPLSYSRLITNKQNQKMDSYCQTIF